MNVWNINDCKVRRGVEIISSEKLFSGILIGDLIFFKLQLNEAGSLKVSLTVFNDSLDAFKTKFDINLSNLFNDNPLSVKVYLIIYLPIFTKLLNFLKDLIN